MKYFEFLEMQEGVEHNENKRVLYDSHYDHVQV